MPLAPDVVLGERVLIFHPELVNLYGCRVGDDMRIGTFVEIQKNAEVGRRCKISSHTFICEGVTVEDEVFVATGVSMFPGSRAGAGSELRVNSVLHVRSVLPPGTVVPIGWVAAGDPAQLFAPDQHEELWAVQEPLDFPGTVYGVPRGTSMREIMRRQCEVFGPRTRR